MSIPYPPPYSPPPFNPAPYGMPPAAAQGPSGDVVAAGWIMLVRGLLGLLGSLALGGFTLLFAAFAGELSRDTTPSGASFRDFLRTFGLHTVGELLFVVFGALAVVGFLFSLLDAVAGNAVRKGRAWARWYGIVTRLLSISAYGTLTVWVALQAQDGARLASSTLTSVALDVFLLVTLLRRGDQFR